MKEWLVLRILGVHFWRPIDACPVLNGTTGSAHVDAHVNTLACTRAGHSGRARSPLFSGKLGFTETETRRQDPQLLHARIAAVLAELQSGHGDSLGPRVWSQSRAGQDRP